MKNTLTKPLLIGGIAGPVIFTLLTIICGSLRPGYNHLHNFISELGASTTPNSQLMNLLGFIPTGISFMAFGLGLWMAVPAKKKLKLASALMFIFGLGVMLAGFFSCDVGCPLNGTTEAVVHDRVSLVAFFSAITAMFLFGSFFKGSNKNLSVYSKFSAVATLLFLAAMILSYPFEALSGLWQRLMLLSIFLWSSIVAIRILRKS